LIINYVNIQIKRIQSSAQTPISSLVNNSNKIECSIRPSMIYAFSTPPFTAIISILFIKQLS